MKWARIWTLWQYIAWQCVALTCLFSEEVLQEAEYRALDSSTSVESYYGAPSKPFIALYPHKSVYILPLYHSFSAPIEGNMSNETKFQFSFKLDVINALFSQYGHLYFAYTQSAWFQNYNRKDSKPFRDLDYEPEIFYSYEKALDVLGGQIKAITLGYNHISNGERALRSRTQNRILATLHWQYHNMAHIFGIKLGVWSYIGTNRDGFLHDNPDLPTYRGYSDVRFYYKHDNHLLEAYMRPIIARAYHPHFELGYTYRISHNIGLYVQYTNGYGDNMYEYKTHSNRLGIGVRLWEK